MTTGPWNADSHSDRIEAALNEECARHGIPALEDKEALAAWASGNPDLWRALLAFLAWFAEGPSAARAILDGHPWPPQILGLRNRMAVRLRELEAEAARTSSHAPLASLRSPH
jgi:hypothetical protein